MSERPTKRLRGSYAKLICLHCRERRIKCQIPDDVEIDLSGNPQPPDKSCERCRQRGLQCIIRRTTLGRPAQKGKTVVSAGNAVHDDDPPDVSSHSPEPSDLVLLDLDHDDVLARAHSQLHLGSVPTNIQLVRAIAKNFDMTTALLARHYRSGGGNVQVAVSPRPLESLIDRALAQQLDQHLVWVRLYFPWIPQIVTLLDEIAQKRTQVSVSTRLLLALLASVALDMPSSRITTEQRLLRSDLQRHIKSLGQEVLFILPRHRHTTCSLLLIHEFRPLALFESHEAAAHTLNGVLYHHLASVVLQQLAIDSASSRLQLCLTQTHTDGNISQLMLDTIQWCLSQSVRIEDDFYSGDVDRLKDTEPEHQLDRAFTAVATAIDRGHGTISHLFAFHFAQCLAEYVFAVRRLAQSWPDLTLLASVIRANEELCDKRRASLESRLDTIFYPQGKTEEALAVLQILSMEMNLARANVVGLALFFAIVSVAHNTTQADPRGETVELRRYYSSAVHEIEQLSDEESDIVVFLEKYGDMHTDGLERKLSDFISIANEVQLDGVAFLGPMRHTTTNVLITCKDIVENNAVRLRLDGVVHPRVDMQLILFQEAARRLENMEVDGGSSDAVARGSVFTAAAKLIRSLHRILSQWKRSQLTKQHPLSSNLPSTPSEPQMPTPASDSTHAFPSDIFTEPSGLFPDDFFADWGNWPQLNAAELAHAFPFDYDPGPQ